ncbi:N-6 DNA methylase [Macrococcoides canis]|uniref:N-6 DNA methylase n=1 Tax=Macrococcoides canis TaxID=1855823 RepID=UPI00165D43B2|nr:N-6 DNA methylase [Macrococcus canis]QNR07785.1 N-6 DNA methylase [Macrococcus canis]
MLKDFFNEQLNIKEAHELPDKLMHALMNNKEQLFDAFIDKGMTTDVDTMNDFFQSEHSDRNSFMQDFTPSSITKVVKGIIEKQHSIADICGGVGGLSNELEYDDIYIEELSKRAIPLLLFVLAIRNKKATVWNGDSLTGEVNEIYQLTPTDKYSEITITNTTPRQFDALVSNPPYSLKWDDKKLQDDDRFVWYPTAPKSKADYAFVLHGLSKLKDNGTMAFVLPHGVLFRGSNEGKIRQQLIEENLLDTVIGMPGDMFFNTSIPTVILVFKKNRENKNVLFIDASRDTQKNKQKYNYLTDDQIEKVLVTYKHRMEVSKYSHVADIEEIKQNDFNLNIPRYVDTYEPEPVPDLIETLKEIIDVKEEIKIADEEIYTSMLQLIGTTPESKKELEEARPYFERLLKDAKTR